MSAPSTLAIENARLIDPSTGRDTSGHLYIADGRIAAVGSPPRDSRRSG